MGGVLAAKALGLGVGLGGMYVAGKATDANKSAGRKAPSAAKAVEEVAGKTTAMSLGSGLAVFMNQKIFAASCRNETMAVLGVEADFCIGEDGTVSSSLERYPSRQSSAETERVND